MRLFSLLLFYVVLTPVAKIFRTFGWKGLDIGFDDQCKSYWIERKPTAIGKHTLKRQS
jgi:hypothetical protein